VAITEHTQGLAVARQLIEQLPPAARREAERLLDDSLARATHEGITVAIQFTDEQIRRYAERSGQLMVLVSLEVAAQIAPLIGAPKKLLRVGHQVAIVYGSVHAKKAI
jgi:hypothetical protein